MSKYEDLAKAVIDAAGGEANISGLTHCATRLRIVLSDMQKADKTALKSIDGVVDIIEKGNKLQIVIGSEASDVYNAAMKLWTPKGEKPEGTKEKQSVLNRIIDFITGVFTPIIFAIAGAGMLKAIFVTLIALNLVSAESSTVVYFNIIADAAFYFLPIFLAYTSAKKLGCNPFLAMVIAGALLHPDFTALFNAGAPTTMLGIPVILTSYSASVVPILLSVWFMSYVEKLINKIIPKSIELFVKPLLILLITGPIVIAAIGPLGVIIGSFISKALIWLNSYVGWLALGIIGALTPLMVMTGMHYALFPFIFQAFATEGFEMLVMPAFFASNIAMGAATLFVAIRTKNRQLRQLAGSTGFTAILGITEPALYGVTLKLRKPFISAMIGGGAAGIFAGIIGVKTYAITSPGLAALPIFVDNSNNFMLALMVVGVAIIATVIASLLIGINDPQDDAAFNNLTTQKSLHKKG